MLKEDLKHITTEHLRDTNKISVRTANCCISVGLNTLYEIILCFEKNGSFFKKKIKNAGRRTCEELDELCANIIPNIVVEKPNYKIKEVFEIISELTEQGRKTLLSLAILTVEAENIAKNKKRIFEKHCINDFSFASDFYIRNGYLPMFWILEQFFVNDDTRDTQILINSFPIFQNKQVFSLEEIATKFIITRERVRQLRIKAFRNTFEITDETANFQNNKYNQLLQNKDNDWDYTLKLLQDEYINQESSDIQECLKKEQCSLSTEFALQIIAYLFRDTFSLFNGFEITNKEKIWKNTFLIKKEYADIFDFEKFIEEFKKDIANNEKEYWLEIDEYIINSQCWLRFDFNKSNIIARIVRDILLNELYLYSDDIDGKIKIPAKKERNPVDIVYEILQQYGNPMHIEEIFVEFKRISPEHKYTEASQLRPFLYRNEAISHRNRKSIFALKEWEHIRRTGTIRDAIVEFLSSKESPQSVEDITDYVIQFFSTTQKNIHSTMFSGKKFIQYRDNLFGLENKQYSSEYEQIEQQKQRKTFEQRLYDLEKFIIENEHFPFSSSKDKEEVSLCRWWKRVVDGKNPVTENQQNEVLRVQLKYGEYDIDKSVYEWNLNYNKAKAFLLENRRPPFAKENEKFLYGWLRRAKEDFQSYRLNEEQRKKYIELSKMF